MKKHSIITLLMVMVFMATGVQTASAQHVTKDSQPSWYVGLGGGTSFGQATFSSITEAGVRSWGIQGGVFGGYKFSRLVSLEAGFQYGQQKQYNLTCCPYWLATDGTWKATQVLDKDGWYFDDLTVPTRWFKIGLQANFNLLSFIKSNNRWFLDLSPQISAVNTKSTWQGNLSHGQGYHEEVQAANWHLGLGGQLGFAYAFNDLVKLGIYGGVTALTGKRFDMIPNTAHKTNLIWDAGLKLTFSFGKNKKKEAAAVAAAEAAAAAEAVRLAAEQAAKEQAAREAAQKAAQEKAAQEAAAKAAQEQAAREAAEAAAAAEATRYYHGTFQNVYFADNSIKLGPETAKLDEVARILEQYPNTTVALYGYASKTGEEAYNLRMTEKRVEKVKKYLVEKGIDPDRITPIVGMGVDHDAKWNKDARRVEIVVVEK